MEFFFGWLRCEGIAILEFEVSVFDLFAGGLGWGIWLRDGLYLEFGCVCMIWVRV